MTLSASLYKPSSKLKRLLRHLLVVVTFIALVASTFLATIVAERLGELRSAPHDNTQWMLLQVQSEFNKLQLVLERVTDDNSLKQFYKRFDIFYSRIDLLKNGVIFQSVLEHPKISEQFRKIVAFTENTAQLIDTHGAGSPADREQIWSGINEVSETVQSFVLSAVSFFAEEADHQRGKLIRLLHTTAISVFLLVSILVIGTVILMRQKRILQVREIDLGTSQQVLSATVCSSLDAVIATDSNGRVMEFNPAAETIFGYRKADVIGKQLSNLIIPERLRAAYHAKMQYFLYAAGSNVGQRVELQAINASGSELPVEMSFGCAIGNNGPIFVAFLRDIAERKRQEEDRKVALERAEYADAAKSRFLAIMSHEMRTPLNGILGLLDLLKDTELEDEQREFVATASTSGEILLGLINDVLDLSKLESGKFHLDAERFNLRSLINSVEKVVHVELARQQNALHIDINADVPSFMFGDANRVRQIVLNFVSNAVKFTRGGHITVSARRIGGDDIWAEIEIDVQDNGIGIPEHQISNLFEDFTMLDTAYQRRVGGTGLGLAICKRLASAMGGAVGAESEFGKGSRFWVRLRLERAEDEDMSQVEQSEQLAVYDVIKDRTILLVEDNPTNMIVASGMLEKAGAKILRADDGNEAVKAAHDEGIDLILMDISMPEMDGIEATRLIRAIPDERGKVPIIAMTAHAFKEDHIRFLAAGMNDYLPKPVRRKRLLETIAACLSGHPTASNIDKENIMDDSSNSLPVFNHSVIAALAEETNPELARETARQFVVEMESHIADLRKAVANADATQARKTAHALKGSSSVVGAARLNALAAQMEEAYLDGQTHKAVAMLKYLLLEASTAAEALGDYGRKPAGSLEDQTLIKVSKQPDSIRLTDSFAL